MVLVRQEGLRFTITVHGEQFVMIVGTSTMLVLSADSLVFQMLKMLTRIVTLVVGLDQFCLTIFVVTVTNHRYFHALMEEWEDTTVVIMRTQGYAVKKLKGLQVRMYDKKLNMFKKCDSQRNYIQPQPKC